MLDIANSYVAKIVAFVLTPVLLPVAGVVANWAQDALGLNLDGTELTAYVVSVIVGLALVVMQYLRGRAEWEVAIAKVQELHDRGAGVH